MQFSLVSSFLLIGTILPQAAVGKARTVKATSAKFKDSLSGSSSANNAPIGTRENFDWLDCETFMGHFDTLAQAANVPSPMSLKGYSPYSCELIFRHYKKNPDAVDAIVNLAHHVENRRLQNELHGERRQRRTLKLKKTDEIENVASKLRGTHMKQRLTRKLYSEQSPQNFERILADADDYLAFDINNTQATQITDCEPASEDDCPHTPCVAEYLFVDTYFEFQPGYGGSAGYTLGTALLKNPVTALSGVASAVLTVATDFDTSDANEVFWTGVDADRTDTGNIGFLLVLAWTQGTAEIVHEELCELAPDDIEVPLVGFDLPNPFKIACEVLEAILKVTGLVIGTLVEQAEFQDSIVDGAEMEAAYENSRNLLQKQCAIFDQAVCRCQDDAEPAGTYGQGCDGKDSNCNYLIDECDEDIVLPTIDVGDATVACTSPWFATIEEAVSCVTEHIDVTDDCQETTETFTSVDSCGESTVTVSTVDACNTDSPVTATIPVQVDGTAPTVSCSFTTDSVTTTGTSVLTDLGFTYEAADNCGGSLNVTATVYSSEIEDFNAQELALFYQDTTLSNDMAKLYLAVGICSTSSSGQCIQDPMASDARLYTVVVSAVDDAGLTGTSECSIAILPNGNSDSKDTDTSLSTQRFKLTSYTSTFTDY